MGYTQKLGLLAQSVFQDSSLNVGIGAAPSGTYKFEVTGTAKVSTSAYFAIASGSVGIGTITPTSYFYSGNGLAIYNASQNTLSIATDTSGTSSLYFSNGASGAARYNGYLEYIHSTNSMTFGTGGFTRLSLASTGNALFTGQIKTSFAGQSISVDGGSTASVRMQLQNTSGNAGVTVESSTGGDQFSGTSAYSMAIGTYTAKDFHIGTNSVTRMTILSDGTTQLYAGTNQATGGAYNTFGNLYVASTSGQGTDIGGSISIGGKFNGAGAYATFARIQGKKENSSSGQTGGYLAFEVCTDVTNLNTERMRISSGGCVAIGTNVPNDAYRLLISGSDTTASNYCLVVRNSNPTNLIYVRNDGYLYSITAWTGSDRRLKENITDLETGLDKVLGLKARKFDFIDGFKNQFGFIAQEVQEVIPDAVSVFQEEDQMLAIKMDFIVPHLVKAIQELNQQNQDLKSRLDKAGL